MKEYQPDRTACKMPRVEDASDMAKFQFHSIPIPDDFIPAGGSLIHTNITWNFSGSDPFIPVVYEGDFKTDAGAADRTQVITIRIAEPACRNLFLQSGCR